MRRWLFGTSCARIPLVSVVCHTWSSVMLTSCGICFAFLKLEGSLSTLRRLKIFPIVDVSCCWLVPLFFLCVFFKVFLGSGNKLDNWIIKNVSPGLGNNFDKCNVSC